MGLPWFKLYCDLVNHPKTKALESRLPVDGVGALTRLWAWTATYYPSGVVPEMATESMIDALLQGCRNLPSEVTRYVTLHALLEVGFLEAHRNGHVVHGWSEAQGKHVEMAESNRKRQQRFRERNALRNATRVTPVTPLEENRVEEKREDQKEQKPSPRVKPAAPPTGPVWSAYAEAYAGRYKTQPVRNAMVNGQLVQLVKRLGEAEAPEVAGWYLAHNGARYVAAGHSVGLLLADCEKLRTEWSTGRQITASAARSQDRTQANLDGWLSLAKAASHG